MTNEDYQDNEINFEVFPQDCSIMLGSTTSQTLNGQLCLLTPIHIAFANVLPQSFASNNVFDSFSICSLTSFNLNLRPNPNSFEQAIQQSLLNSQTLMASKNNPSAIHNQSADTLSQPPIPMQTPSSESLEQLLENALQMITSPPSCPNSPCSRAATPVTAVSDMLIVPALRSRSYRNPGSSRSTPRQRSPIQTVFSEPSSPLLAFGNPPLGSDEISIPKSPSILITHNAPVLSETILGGDLCVVQTKASSRPNRTALAISTIAALLDAAAAAAVSNTVFSKNMIGSYRDKFGNEESLPNGHLRNSSVGSISFGNCCEEEERLFNMDSSVVQSEFEYTLDHFSINPSLVINAAASAAKASVAIFMSGMWPVNSGAPEYALKMYRQQHQALLDLHKVLSDITCLLDRVYLHKCDAATNTDTLILVDSEMQTDFLAGLDSETVVDAVLHSIENNECHLLELKETNIKNEVIEEINEVVNELENSIDNNNINLQDKLISSRADMESVTDMVVASKSPSRIRKTSNNSADSLDLKLYTSNPSYLDFTANVAITTDSEKSDEDENVDMLKSILHTTNSYPCTPRKNVCFNDKYFEQVITFDKITSPITIRDTDVVIFKDKHDDAHNPPTNTLIPLNFVLSHYTTSQSSLLSSDHPVCVETLAIEGRTLVGNVIARNISFHKYIIVRYTTNSWTSFAEAEAKYKASINTVSAMRSESSADRFGFYLDCSAIFEDIMAGPCLCDGTSIMTHVLEFVVRYEIGENVGWENNSGENYVVELARRVPKPVLMKKPEKPLSTVSENFNSRTVSLLKPIFKSGLTESLADKFLDKNEDVNSVTTANVKSSFKYNECHDTDNNLGNAGDCNSLGGLADESQHIVDSNKHRNFVPDHPSGTKSVVLYKPKYAQDCEVYKAVALKTPAFASGADVNREDDKIRKPQKLLAQMKKEK
ncbi:hypothetical protein HK096_003803, partial [Nowakowskiella sp. JEL0078]